VLRVIDSSQTCGKSETALNWNQPGIAGPTGPTGATGPAGAGSTVLLAVVSAGCSSVLGGDATGMSQALPAR
jgi:hypothetical protein